MLITEGGVGLTDSLIPSRKLAHPHPKPKSEPGAKEAEAADSNSGLSLDSPKS